MKKFWTIYTVLCCIFCCEMASAQNLTKISGTVLDENNAPMAGVTISVNGKGAPCRHRTEHLRSPTYRQEQPFLSHLSVTKPKK